MPFGKCRISNLSELVTLAAAKARLLKKQIEKAKAAAAKAEAESK